MRYLTFSEVLELHRRILETSGGMGAIRDLGLLESAVAQPRMTFRGSDLSRSGDQGSSALFLVGHQSSFR